MRTPFTVCQSQLIEYSAATQQPQREIQIQFGNFRNKKIEKFAKNSFVEFEYISSGIPLTRTHRNTMTEPQIERLPFYFAVMNSNG